MSVAATTYKRGVRQQSKAVESDLAAKMLAGKTGCDAVEVWEGNAPARFYVLSLAEGRLWHGPWTRGGFDAQYLSKLGGQA